MTQSPELLRGYREAIVSAEFIDFPQCPRTEHLSHDLSIRIPKADKLSEKGPSIANVLLGIELRRLHALNHLIFIMIL